MHLKDITVMPSEELLFSQREEFAPETIRTSDLLLRRQLLYPAELPEHGIA